MKTELLNSIPVLPSADIDRDIAWHKEKTGFLVVSSDPKYAVLSRENLRIHLQWHADTEEDPVLGGSVVRIHVKNIQPLFQEYIERGTITKDRLRINTPWKTIEFGFYDLNKNVFYIMEDSD